MGYPHPSHPRETPVLSRHFGEPEARTLHGWRGRGGYQALEKALGMAQADIVNIVKESGLRGRGGAGFPTGMKWSFMKPGDGKPHYLCCNADESEPGTFKDREIMRWTPHALVEGCAIGAWAMGAETTYIYIRGEFTEPLVWMDRAIREAYEAGILGANAMGSGKRIDVHVHKGAGAYICGEETALMESLEGRRGNPRIKPPFPAVSGVFGMPTTINNVETLAAVPAILMKGADWYKGMSLSNPKSTGTKLFSVCGNVQRPGTYEVVMGFPFGEFLHDVCGGGIERRKFKAVIPGGASVPIQTMAEAEATLMDYEGFRGAGLDARLRRSDRNRRRAVDGVGHRAPRALLRARELRAVHAMPRGHGLDDQDPRAHSRRAGNDGRSRYAPRHRRQHDRHDDLRSQRFVRDSGDFRDKEIPA